jgi:hypothetical protein
MNQIDHILNLKETLKLMDEASDWLKRSYDICSKFKEKVSYTKDEFDALETLTSRYGRLVDLLISKVFRTIDAVEFVETGTILDSINRTEKRGIVEDVDQIRIMKDLRNEIVHEYNINRLTDIFKETLETVPTLLDIATSVKSYCSKKSYIDN